MGVQDIILQQDCERNYTGLLLCLVALGFSMVYGIIKLLNFAHGDILYDRSFCWFAILGLVSGVLGNGG